MRVNVDRDRCEGNAVCLGIAPDMFDLDDEDYAVVKTDPIPPGQEDLAEQAIAECPRAALLAAQLLPVLPASFPSLDSLWSWFPLLPIAFDS